MAAQNVALHGLEERVRLLESDLFAGIGNRTYDVIVSNPPYVGAAELEGLPEEYRKEPRIALAAGESGLEFALRILCDAPEYLREGGILIVELGNTAAELERRFPDLPFLWLEFERGGEGVCLMTREQLIEFHPLFAQAAEQL